MTNYPYRMQLVVDPDNPRNVVAAGSVSIYDSEDTAHTTLLTLTDPSGVPIPNPITSNANGFTPPFVTTSPEVLWVSGPYTDYFQSYKGMRDEAVAAKAAAENAAATAGAEAAAVAEAAIGTATDEATAAAASAAAAASSSSASATAAANAAALVGAPADSAVAALINASGSAARGALNATYAPITGSANYVAKVDTIPLSIYGMLLHKVNGGLTVALGDSLTSPGAYERSYFEQLAPLSGQRIGRLYNAGISGNTVQMMRDRLSSDVLSKKPERVLLMAGTNNNGLNDWDSATAAYKEILDRLAAAGVAVVCISIPPRSGVVESFHDFIAAWNTFVQAEATRRGLPYVNAHDALDDGTGNYKPEYTSDNLHMSAAGAAVQAKAVWAVLAPLYPAAPAVYLTESATDTTNLYANGTFLDTTPADGTPDGFTITNAPTRATTSIITNDARIKGNAFRITRTEASTGAFSISRTITTGFAVGDEMEMAVRFNPADGHALVYNIYANVAQSDNTLINQPYPIRDWTVDFDGAWATAYLRFTIPPLAGRIQMYCSTTSGLGSIDFAQFTMRNLTALAKGPAGPAGPTFPTWGTYPAVTLMTSNSDTASILLNPLLTDASPVDGLPDNWSQTSAPTRATVSVGTDAGVTGNYVRITRAESGTGSFSVNQSRTTGFAVGDTLEAAVKFRSPSNAVTANFYLLCVAADGTTSLLNKQILTNWANQTDGFQTAAGTFTVPTGTVTIRFYMSTASGIGYVDFAQATLRKAA